MRKIILSAIIIAGLTGCGGGVNTPNIEEHGDCVTFKNQDGRVIYECQNIEAVYAEYDSKLTIIEDEGEVAVVYNTKTDEEIRVNIIDIKGL